MAKRGGYRPNAGRPKGSKNKENKALAELLEDEKLGLLQKAIKLAKSGNVPIMTKLLDKIVPTLTFNENDNTNKNLTPDEMLRVVIQNALGERAKLTESSNNTTTQEAKDANIPQNSTKDS